MMGLNKVLLILGSWLNQKAVVTDSFSNAPIETRSLRSDQDTHFNFRE
jgi:hypothetical protein